MASTVGKRLKEFREFKQMKQGAFSEVASIRQQTLSTLEADGSVPSYPIIEKLMVAFPDLSADWLLMGRGEMLTGGRALTPVVALAPPLAVTEPAAAYVTAAPAAATLIRQLSEAHTRIQELESELKEERKQARQDLRSQAALYNSVKEDQSQLITRLYNKLDEYELLLGYRKPTAAEREQQQKQQAGSGAPRLEMIPFGARYRESAPDEPQASGDEGGKVLALYPDGLVSLRKAA